MRCNYPPMERGSADDLAVKKYLLEDFGAFFQFYSGLNPAEFQPTVFEAMALEHRLVLYLPGTHGKSTTAKWYCIWRIAQNPNIRIILGMKTDTEVSNYARSIRKELAGNHKLIRDFGPFVPKGRDVVWSNDAIEVFYRQITESQPTIEFTSSKAVDQVLGHRCDEYIWDDVVTPTTTNTQEQRDKQETSFNTGINTGPQYLWDRNPEWTPDGRLPFFLNKPDHIYWPTDINLRPYGRAYIMRKGMLMGTSFDPDDLLHRKGREPQDLYPGKLYKGNASGFKVLYYDCWLHTDKNELTDKPLFPSRWTKEELMAEEKSIGSIDFNKRYRNIAIDESMTVFRKIWLKGNVNDGGDFPGCMDRGRSWEDLPYYTQESREVKWFITLGLDPSSGRKGDAFSWSAYVLLAMDLMAPEPRRRYVLDIYRAQMGFQDILSHLMDGGTDAVGAHIQGLWAKHHYNLAIVEQNAAQKWLLTDLRRKAFELNNPGVRIEGMETQAGNKWDPVAGVASMQSMIQDGLLSIPCRTPSDREKTLEFTNQLLSFPEGICDYAMALWFAQLGMGDSHRKLRHWSRGPGIIMNQR